MIGSILIMSAFPESKLAIRGLYSLGFSSLRYVKPVLDKS